MPMMPVDALYGTRIRPDQPRHFPYRIASPERPTGASMSQDMRGHIPAETGFLDHRGPCTLHFEDGGAVVVDNMGGVTLNVS